MPLCSVGPDLVAQGRLEPLERVKGVLFVGELFEHDFLPVPVGHYQLVRLVDLVAHRKERVVSLGDIGKGFWFVVAGVVFFCGGVTR